MHPTDQLTVIMLHANAKIQHYNCILPKSRAGTRRDALIPSGLEPPAGLPIKIPVVR